MPKAAPLLSAFNAGELSPLLEGRVDLDKYHHGCRRLRNFVPTVQGPVKRRAGWRFCIGGHGTEKGWVYPFVSSVAAVYVLEFTPGKIYVYKDDSDTTREKLTEVTHVDVPYTAGDLTRADGSFGLSISQSADVAYISHPSYVTKKLSRTGASTFTIADFLPTGGPWKPQNTDKTITIIASAITGAGITLTASSALFTSAMVGQIVRLEQKDLADIKPWEPGQKTPNMALNVLRRSDSKTYKCTSVTAGPVPATGGGAAQYVQTGGVRPTHTSGKAWDGDQTGTVLAAPAWYSTGVEWEYQDCGYGVVQITGYTDSTHVTATVLTQLPATLATTASYRWEFGAWNATDGYPEVSAFYKERLVFARGIKLWMSVAGDFENFEDKDFGEVLPDSAITIDVLRNQANAITWLAEGEGLLVGTTGGEFVVRPAQTTEPLGPANIESNPQSKYGSLAIRPERVGASTLFVQRGGKKVRDLVYSFENDNFIANDMAVLAEHIAAAGLTMLAFATDPDSVLWAVDRNGQLIGFTYNKEQDVAGWHAHPTDGVIESLCVVPNLTQARDIVFASIRRTINGSEVRYLEAMSWGQHASVPAQSVFLDCAITTATIAGPKITGLAHLLGRTVDVLLDGATHAPREVVDLGGGVIGFNVDREADVAIVGLPYTSTLETMRLEAGAADGTAQGKLKRIARIVLRFYRTIGALVGPDDDHLDRVEFRKGSQPMDQAVPEFTGDSEEIAFDSGYEREGRMVVVQNQPLPLTLVALMPRMESQ